MPKKTRWRSKADELLLNEGPQNEEDLRATMADMVHPGAWDRQLASWRKGGPDTGNKNRGDDFHVGSRAVVSQTVCSAMRFGVWIREGDKIRHRDWVGVVAA
jgi:hypothetical protein